MRYGKKENTFIKNTFIEYVYKNKINLLVTVYYVSILYASEVLNCTIIIVSILHIF